MSKGEEEKIVPGPWVAPKFGCLALKQDPKSPKKENLESIIEIEKSKAYAKGFSKGAKDAEEKHKEYSKNVQEKFSELIDKFDKTLNFVDDVFLENFEKLLKSLLTNILRQEYQQDKLKLKDLISDLVDELPVSNEKIKFIMSEEDKQFYDENKDKFNLDMNKEIVIEGSPELLSGDIEVKSSISKIDCKIDSRVKQAVEHSFNKIN